MKKILLLFLTATLSKATFSQNIFYSDFSTFNITKIDGQNGWSSATPSAGNGTGACAGVSCISNSIVAKSMSYNNFGTCTQALNPVDGTLATGDGPGKSLGSAVTSGSVYVALLVNFNSPLASPTSGKQVIRLMDNGFTTATRLYIKMASGGGAFLVGVDKNGGSAIYSSASYSYGQDHLIIIKYKFNSSSTTDDVATVFVDPNLSSSEPTTPDASAAGSTDATTINRVAFPWNSSSNPNGYIGIVSVSKDWNNIFPQATTYKIEGRAISAQKKPIQTSTIKLTTASTKDSTITTVAGTYSFANLATNDYTIKPTKNNDIAKANGVNSADVLLIQRHVLNTAKITNAYKLIAADVDGNKIINATDVLRTKRLILGTDTTFTKTVGTAKINRLWEFVDSAYIFPDTTNPFPFKDSISLTSLSADKANQTFIGVKLGDVNDSWNPALAKHISSSINLTYNATPINNNIYNINIVAKNFKEVAAMQYSIGFDSKQYEFVGIKNNLLQQDYNAQKTKGNIGLLWVNDNGKGKTLESGVVLLTIQLRAKFNVSTVPEIYITNASTYSEDLSEQNIILSK